MLEQRFDLLVKLRMIAIEIKTVLPRYFLVVHLIVNYNA